MPYTTLEALVERYGEAAVTALSDRGPVPRGVPDAAVVARAIADAEALVDGYLGGRYVLPLAAVPPLVADLTAAIAWWKLHIHEPDPKAKADHEAAIRTLKDIAAGSVRIPAAGIEPAPQPGNGVRVTDRARPLTADDMTGFI